MKVEGFWRAHQVPIANPRGNPDHLKLLEQWMKSYRPEELFDESGRLVPELQALAPKGNRRMGANPHANGGLLKRELKLPDFRGYAVEVATPGGIVAEATRELGKLLREVVTAQRGRAQFPHHGARRNRIQPAGCGVRGNRPRLDGGDRAL